LISLVEEMIIKIKRRVKNKNIPIGIKDDL
jgi:hypothetical protein